MIKQCNANGLMLATLAVLVWHPIADFIAFNFYQAGFSILRCTAYFGLLFIVLASLTWGLTAFLGKQRGPWLALTIGLTSLMLFNNYAVEQGLQQWLGEQYRFRYLLLANVLAIPVIALVSAGIAKIRPFHYAFLGTLLVTACFSVFSTKQQQVHYQALAIDEYEPATKRQMKGPNVYYLVPDGFNGVEMFNRLAETKLWIDQELADKGFRVIHNAYSNGSATLLSLPQVYSMQYLFEENEVVKGQKVAELGALYQRQSPVTREFRRRGYKFYRLADGMTGHCYGTEDKCIDKPSIFANQDVVFFNRTLMPSLLAHKLWWSKGLIPGQMEMDQFIPYLPKAEEGPFFLIGHFALPHNPFRFDKDCNPLGYSSVFSSTQAYFDKKPGRDRFSVYEGQTHCARKLLLKLVDGILARDPNAIIVIQADHGSQDYFDPYHQDYHALTKDNFYESFNILYAFYGPESLTQQLYDGFSPVNTFRLIFSWLDNEPVRLLPHRAFYGIINKKVLQAHDATYVMREWHDAPVPNKASS